MQTIRILYADNGVGLTHDAALLKTVLQEHGYNVIEYTGDINSRVTGHADLNIHLEIVYRGFLHTGRHVLIPNPEWFFTDWKRHLKQYALILCKTHDAARIFAQMGMPVEYIGFTSRDRYDPTVKKLPRFVHFAGQSTTKGTPETLLAFSQPDMPDIDVYGMQPSITKFAKKRANMRVHTVRLSDSDMRHKQNECMYHVCCSNYEGFGHYIHEAKSCGAFIITTNAAPMNEFIRQEFGIGVSVRHYSRQGFAKLATPNYVALAEICKQLSTMDMSIASKLGEQARHDYKKQDLYFRTSFPTVIKKLLST